MKRLILTIGIILCSLFVFSQATIKRDGNTFYAEKSTTTSSCTLTVFKWKDSKGVEYPIYRSKKGAYYVIRTSNKTGEEYKYYLPKEVQVEIRKIDK